MLTWFQLTVVAEIDAIESLKALFLERGFAEIVIEKTTPHEDKPCLMLTTYIPADEQADLRLTDFEHALWHFQAFGLCYIKDPTVSRLPSLPITAEERQGLAYFTIGESWLIKRDNTLKDRPAGSESRHQLTIKHGSAFGTGLHPSTRLILELLETLPVANKRVLDVGTGSGILALASGYMSAQSVRAIDIDSQAANDVAVNLALNPNLKACLIQTETAALSQISGEFDLILANLPAPILQQNVAHLTGSLYRGGHLLLSGYRQTHQALIQDTFTASGLEKKAETSDNTWIATCWEKPKTKQQV